MALLSIKKQEIKMKSSFFKIIICLALITLCKDALCSDTGTSALPYESWLRTIQKSLTGPVAFSVAIIGIVSCGATLIFSGGELGKFMKSIVYLVMVMTLLVGANSLMTSLFNGADIGDISSTNKATFIDSRKNRELKQIHFMNSATTQKHESLTIFKKPNDFRQQAYC